MLRSHTWLQALQKTCWNCSSHVCNHQHAGVPKTGTCRIDWFRSETDKQLVHQSEETPLETFRGYAVCGDGRNPSPLLHGQRYGQSVPHGLHAYASMIYIFQTWKPWALYIEQSVVMSNIIGNASRGMYYM